MYDRVVMVIPFRRRAVLSRGSGAWLVAAVALLVASEAAASPEVDLGTLTRRGRRFVADLEGGGLAELTLDAGLQQAMEETLAAYALPYGAAVAISIPDGRVLALAGRSSLDPSLGPAELALRPWAPAASVF